MPENAEVLTTLAGTAFRTGLYAESHRFAVPP